MRCLATGDAPSNAASSAAAADPRPEGAGMMTISDDQHRILDSNRSEVWILCSAMGRVTGIRIATLLRDGILQDETHVLLDCPCCHRSQFLFELSARAQSYFRLRETA